MEASGFEPPNSERAVLQTAAFSHFARPPEWRETESNRRHKELQSFALPTELPSHNVDNIILIKLLINTTVLTGFEPVISCVTGRRDNPYTIGPFVFSGGYRARTCDPLLVRQTLSQLS